MKIVKSEDLVRTIPDGCTIAFTGFGGMGQCDRILMDIRRRFLETGHPKNLTIFHAAGQSDRNNGIEYLAEEGLIKRIIGGHWGLAPKIRKMIEDNKIDAYCLPQGQLTHLFRTIANGLPGQISPIGLGTFVDPRIDGGKFNERTKTKENLVEILTIDDQEYLFYKAISFDYVLIRGTSADENGNITTEEEPLKLEILSAAQAAKACGGKVIVQVKYLAKSGTFHPKEVVIPGYLVDYVVIAENPMEEHRQIPNCVYHPVYSGELRVPVEQATPLPMSVRKIIGRRAVQELTKNAVVNLGIGIPGDVIGPITVEEGLNSDIILTIESGIIGGVPIGSNQFGIAKNAEVILDHGSQFDHYHGAGVDLAFMGAAEVDRFGNVNVSKFGNRSVGCGGFIDVTQPAKKVIFCTTFTTGGLEVEIDRGKIRILQEGKNKKFVSDVNQITFSGKYAAKHDKKVIYVTERAVFQLTLEGLELVEIAPGIDLERDILGQMDFQPKISDHLKLMDPRIFQPSPMELIMT
ncbi:propionate CoA-transferase [Collibacillus ludicampi]|uniref:Propionate CoA-transferase n=1 Tax=Collibacillus ludicampi TaxID=2771369 RepID=A0AAV4LCE3_9BACL|nr:CoA-transferase [Collibacillus ludicampi]GIM45517.1 propionate CoA-transferase [Collibacillus ludicampi]